MTLYQLIKSIIIRNNIFFTNIKAGLANVIIALNMIKNDLKLVKVLKMKNDKHKKKQNITKRLKKYIIWVHNIKHDIMQNGII